MIKKKFVIKILCGGHMSLIILAVKKLLELFTKNIARNKSNTV